MYGRVTITMNATVPTLKGVRLKKRALADCMVRGYYDSPRGHTMSLPGRGHKPLRLASQLMNERNITITEQPNELRATGTVRGAGAAIQNFGGIIRERLALRKAVMKFTYFGATVVARRVGPSEIRAKHYIERGLRRVRDSLNAVVEYIWIKREIS